MASVNDVVLTVTFSLLSLTDFVGNVLVCLIILQRKRFRFRRWTLDYLFLNLALADITVAVFAIPRYVLNHAFAHPLGSVGDFLCRFVTGGNLMWTGGAASVFTLVTIAFERRHASRPYQVGQKLSKPKLRVLVLSSWISACLLNLPLFFIMSYDSRSNFCIENWPHPLLPKVYGIIWFSVVGAIPIIIMVVLYSKVAYHLWVKRSVARLHRTALLIPKKATKMAITLTVIYSICWLPNLILYILVFNISDTFYGSPLYGWTVVLTCLNSAVNPFVYTLQSRRFRASAKQALLCK
ncbi:pyroglutamylated RFamide peptide receptor-like [Orbicella faveolata]|uniref:pyroglutamylated RFamide peptide receptor-like n=1 Tax=Orbicella faveolata TaxID=48498 RepID=UPI0009E453A0|nr:pyroglutamylated RFamide peptide receptor-like [Orbicella faveolata]